MKYKLIAFDEKVQILMDPPLTLTLTDQHNPTNIQLPRSTSPTELNEKLDPVTNNYLTLNVRTLSSIVDRDVSCGGRCNYVSLS